MTFLVYLIAGLIYRNYRFTYGKKVSWRIDDMDNLPNLNKKIVTVTSLDHIEEEKKYWFSKSPLERIEAIEINRRMIYGQDRVTSRLQRFFETAELS
jgi:hypothetical protein